MDKRSKASKRIGETFTNKHGSTFTIIQYYNANSVIVEFNDEHHYRVHTAYHNCVRGKVRNPYDRIVYDIGYLGVQSNGEVPKWDEVSDNIVARAYHVWYGILQRCYDVKFHENNPTYRDCTVDEQLHSFSYFLEHMNLIENYDLWLNNPNDRIAIDKDIKIPNNKHYSIETCIFVSQTDNTNERLERCGNGEVKVVGTLIKTGEVTVFDSITQASQYTGASMGNITKCCKKEKGYKSAKGYRWEYLKE